MLPCRGYPRGRPSQANSKMCISFLIKIRLELSTIEQAQGVAPTTASFVALNSCFLARELFV